MLACLFGVPWICSDIDLVKELITADSSISCADEKAMVSPLLTRCSLCCYANAHRSFEIALSIGLEPLEDKIHDGNAQQMFAMPNGQSNRHRPPIYSPLRHCHFLIRASSKPIIGIRRHLLVEWSRLSMANLSARSHMMICGTTFGEPLPQGQCARKPMIRFICITTG